VSEGKTVEDILKFKSPCVSASLLYHSKVITEKGKKESEQWQSCKIAQRL
jgi:hypothetical protein